MPVRRGLRSRTPRKAFSTKAITTIVWVATTYLTPPAADATLDEFYRKVRPAGPGWERVRRRTGAPASPDSLPSALLGWVLALVAIYSVLFGTGAYLYGRALQGAGYTVLFLATATWLVRLSSHVWRSKTSVSEVPA